MLKIQETELITQIKDGTFDPLKLNLETRVQIVCILRQEGLKTHEISSLLRVDIRTVDRDIAKIKNKDIALVRNLTIEKVGGSLVRAAEQLRYSAVRKGDFALAWRIECELVDKLQSLGFIYQKPFEVRAEVKTEETIFLKQLPDKDLNDICDSITERLKACIN